MARKKRHCIRGRAMLACEVGDEEQPVARLFDDVLDDQVDFIGICWNVADDSLFECRKFCLKQTLTANRVRR